MSLSSKIKKLHAIPALFICTVAGILGYGYWHSITHASFNVTLHLKTADAEEQQDMPLAEIDFLDVDGKKLATGFNDENYNFVHLLHPEVGDCHETEEKAWTSAGKTAWQECFAKMSTWIPTWAEKVEKVDVRYQGRTFNKIPVNVSAYNSDWFLWWVPLPHIGGKPYTYYRTRINIDSDNY